MKKNILIIHGPNINLTGEREASIYGKETFENINDQIKEYCKEKYINCEIYHSNIEGEIIDKIQSVRNDIDGIIINAGAYTHYSYAIRDAIACVKAPCIEVHFSNIYGREEFRRKSVIAPVCAGTIAGFGKYSYFLAIKGLTEMM
ncbi:MAG: type II 3-dehydroquinate dehydratase [Oscillospiraceae bacterium]